MYTEQVKAFRFFVPPVIQFGRRARDTVPYYAKKLGLKTVLFLVDPYFVDTEHFGEMKLGLEKDGITTVDWHGVVPNPTDVSVDNAAEVYRQNECDGIVSVGGGSALDTAKGVAIMARSNAESVREYAPPTWAPVERMAPMILLPTTAGTGAEVNPWAMITNTVTNKKGVGFQASDLIEAQRVAIIDPDLTMSMPPDLTAITGIDAFCQALECYVCDSPNPISDSIALHSIALVAQSLRRAVYDGSDETARTEMCLASMMATMAFPNAGLSYPHRISTVLYDRWNLIHGIAVAVMTRASLELLLPAKSARIAQVAKVFGVATTGLSERELAMKGIEAVAQMIEDINLPTFKEASGASVQEVDELIRDLRKDSSVPKTTIDRYDWMLRRSLEF